MSHHHRIEVRILSSEHVYSKALNASFRSLIALHLIDNLELDYQLPLVPNLDFFSVEVKRRGKTKTVFTFSKKVDLEQQIQPAMYGKVADEICAEILQQVQNARDGKFIAQLYY